MKPFGSDSHDRHVMILHHDGVPVLSTMVHIVRIVDTVGFLDQFPVESPYEWRAVPAHDMTDIHFFVEGDTHA